MLRLKQVVLERTAYLPDQLILSGLSQVAFAGRSNVGKSSLLNKLFNRKNLAKVSQTPGKTRSVNYFMVNNDIYFVDLPGYGYAKAGKSEQERWRKLADYYFRNCEVLKGLVHLIDIRHEPTELDLALHEWTTNLVENRLYVLTKGDKVSRSKSQLAVNKLTSELRVEKKNVIPFSAVKGTGKQEILTWVDNILKDTY